MHKGSLILFLNFLLAQSVSWGVPTGSVKQLEPSEGKVYRMKLTKDIEMDRFVESDKSFYANSKNYIVDGKIMNSDDYYTNYEGKSHCKINVFDFTVGDPATHPGNTIDTDIVSTIETKDSNWKDGFYNWSSLKGAKSDNRPYIENVSCHIKGTLAPFLTPQVSIQKMQEMLKGVVYFSEMKKINCLDPDSDQSVCTGLIDFQKVEYVNCLGELGDGFEINLCNIDLMDESGETIKFDCTQLAKDTNDLYMLAVCSRLPKPNSVQKINCHGELEDGYQQDLCSSVNFLDQEWLGKVLYFHLGAK